MRINKRVMCADFGVPGSRDRELTHKKTLSRQRGRMGKGVVFTTTLIAG